MRAAALQHNLEPATPTKQADTHGHPHSVALGIEMHVPTTIGARPAIEAMLPLASRFGVLPARAHAPHCYNTQRRIRRNRNRDMLG